MTGVFELPIPPHFDPQRVGDVWRVEYQRLLGEARDWARSHDIRPATDDTRRVGLALIDCQNTFCIPDHELFVAGAVEDNARLCRFMYRHLGRITKISATMDTHEAFQIFHAPFWIDDKGSHPEPLTVITSDDVGSGRWKPNPAVASQTGADYDSLKDYALHYVHHLSEEAKFSLTIWPFHGMLGGIGHAIVSSLEEAIFFHSIARSQKNPFEIKGENTWTEHYSVLRPEVMTDHKGNPIAEEDPWLVEALTTYHAVFIAGQAKSHCLFWTVDNLLEALRRCNKADLISKMYLLEDCTSPVVVPGVVDFTDEADAAFKRFAEAGMRVVKSDESFDDVFSGESS